ncbi:hypothetical protein [uncultured Gammaproteobacteria bacterium]|nr:hypothetical protein [uncultured Gammaproteobacteria bacterium]SHN90268.1 hypothetical protein BHECKSOX_479 [Bathymodiolus heckerae thiotrophic gill symbiont]
MHSEKGYKSGQHALDIFLNIESIYGRLELIAFEFLGTFLIAFLKKSI